MVNMPVKLVFSSVKSLKRSAAVDYWFHGAKVEIYFGFRSLDCEFFSGVGIGFALYEILSEP